MLKETEVLMELFYEKEREIINKIIDEINQDKEDYKTIKLWEFDREIGGIGGYCQGCDPAKSNPFQGTELRGAYRSLQYVRSHIDLCNIHDIARYAIHDCGLHLEEVLKLYAKKVSAILGFKYRNYPLGKLTYTIGKKKVLDYEIINSLNKFVSVYNISKHEIQSSDKIDRTFHAADAIICYFACRKIGLKIILLIEDKKAPEVYELCLEKFGRNIKRF